MSEVPGALMSVEELISSKWTVQILQGLLEGPTSFSDLKEHLPRVSVNILTKRLRNLEQEGLIMRIYLPPPASRQAYTLTPKGASLRAIMEAIRLVSERWAHAPDVPNTEYSL